MDCTVYQTSDKPVCCKGNRVVIESIIQSRKFTNFQPSLFPMR